MEKARIDAVLLAKDEQFWDWAEANSMVGVMIFDEECAANFIRLKIKASRSCIATDPEVYRRYRDLVETPYRMWAGLMAEPR
jgi:hypothetical protein